MSDGVPETKTGSVTRRGFITVAAAAAASIAVPGAAMAGYRIRTLWDRERKLSFYNLHTGESLKTTYFQDGEYVPDALNDINYILRDFRQNEVKPIDPNLLDLLARLHQRLYTRESFDIISGYRSAKTNAMLHTRSEGVAVHSLHLEGKAIDICVPSRSLKQVRRAAILLFAGGVGYYPRSGFVHVDTGRIRYW